MNLILVRHGESEGNVAHRRSNDGDFSLINTIAHKSPSEYRLTDAGITQAKGAGRLLASMNVEFNVIATSPMLRAIETTLHATEVGGIKNTPIVDDFLRERSWGIHDTSKPDPEQNAQLWRDRVSFTHVDWTPAGGDTYTAALARAKTIIDKYLDTGTSDEHYAVLFTHAELIMFIERVLVGHTNASDPRIHAMNQIPHNCAVRHWRLDPKTSALKMRTNSKENLGRFGKWTDVSRVNLTRDDLWKIVGRSKRVIS